MNSDPNPVSVHTEDRFPVSVIMESRDKARGGWRFVDWKVTGILPAREAPAGPPVRTLLHEESGCRRYLWSHFSIALIKDRAESYWNNLMASKPSLFVVCREEEGSAELTPFVVTADYDEIIGYQEVDDQVFSLPIPPELYHWLENYVVNHYVPPERRKRKRTDWVEDSEHTAPPARRH